MMTVFRNEVRVAKQNYYTVCMLEKRCTGSKKCGNAPARGCSRKHWCVHT